MTIRPGQTYRSADPRETIRIRVDSYTPGENRAYVVDAFTGKRPRWVLANTLHASPTTQAGKPRRSGYVLEQPAAARQATGQADTTPEAVPTPEEGIEDARKVMQHVLQLFLDRVPRDELDAETMADALADALSDGLTELYRTAAQAATPAPVVGQPAAAPADEAHPARTQWVIEWYRAAKDRWVEDQPAYNHREDAVDEITRQRRHQPARRLRIVRETTTWTVEDETR